MRAKHFEDELVSTHLKIRKFGLEAGKTPAEKQREKGLQTLDRTWQI